MNTYFSDVLQSVRRPLRAAGIAVLGGLSLLAPSAQADITPASNAELRRLIAEGIAVVDVRTVGEWRQTGVVGGSQLITLVDESGQADPAAWLGALDKVVPPGQPVALICRSGNRSGKAALLLEQRDPRRKIYNVRDGITGWLGAGEPVISLEQNRARPGISCSPRC